MTIYVQATIKLLQKFANKKSLSCNKQNYENVTMLSRMCKCLNENICEILIT